MGQSQVHAWAANCRWQRNGAGCGEAARPRVVRVLHQQATTNKNPPLVHADRKGKRQFMIPLEVINHSHDRAPPRCLVRNHGPSMAEGRPPLPVAVQTRGKGGECRMRRIAEDGERAGRNVFAEHQLTPEDALDRSGDTSFESSFASEDQWGRNHPLHHL